MDLGHLVTFFCQDFFWKPGAVFIEKPQKLSHFAVVLTNFSLFLGKPKQTRDGRINKQNPSMTSHPKKVNKQIDYIFFERTKIYRKTFLPNRKSLTAPFSCQMRRKLFSSARNQNGVHSLKKQPIQNMTA